MISIISVNYNSKEYLEKLLSSIEKHLKSNDIELIVVNNDEKKLKLRQSSIKVNIVHKGKNIGFGTASNIGAQKAKGEWLLFANPDIEFIDASLKKTIDFLNKNKNVAIIGPQIIQFSTKNPQPWTSGEKTSLTQILFRNTIGKPWNKKTSTSVDWVSGTALLISKKQFSNIGGFDEAFFMYFEDQDLCLRVKDSDKKILFYPDFKILHHDGKSWNNKKLQKSYYYKSQDIFFQKHHKFLQRQALKIIRKLTKGQ